MSSTTRGRKIFPSLPHDYIRRRRAVRRITNTCLIAVFNLATATSSPVPATSTKSSSKAPITCPSSPLAFWDAYLKDDAAAKAHLQFNALQNSSHGAIKLSRR
ncbi:MAG TPA: hypothetical protein VIW93_00655 [Candidatus Acidoferrum sp.]